MATTAQSQDIAIPTVSDAADMLSLSQPLPPRESITMWKQPIAHGTGPQCQSMNSCCCFRSLKQLSPVDAT